MFHTIQPDSSSCSSNYRQTRFFILVSFPVKLYVMLPDTDEAVGMNTSVA